MDLERLYPLLPIPLQNVAVSLEGRRIARRRFGHEFDGLLADAQSRTFWPAAQLAAARDARLAAFVAQAVAATPYYRDLFRRLRLRSDDVRTLGDLDQLPVLTKAEVQAEPERFCSTDCSTDEVLWCHTSGSTGAGLRFPVTWRAHREQWAVWWRYRAWHGLQRNEMCHYFGGRSVVPLAQQRPPFWRTNRPGKQVFFSGYHLSAATAGSYLDELARRGARWLHGYPSLLALLAQFAVEAGRRLSVRWITLGAENLDERQARIIQRAFGVRPIQHYGLAEGVANVSQCPAGRLHADEDFAATSFVPAAGGQHRIVGVNFANPAFPLLRYDTGDLATLDELPCSCGRPGRVVAAIDGRQEDLLLLANGAALGRLDHIFKDLVRVREAQIRQLAPGVAQVCIVRGPDYGPADERQLRDEIVRRVGRLLNYEIVYVDCVPRTAAGKVRLVVSSVTPELRRAA